MIKVNNTRTAAVDQTRYWLPVNSDTPIGVKMLLLSVYGTATCSGLFNGHGKHFVGWYPLDMLHWRAASCETPRGIKMVLRTYFGSVFCGNYDGASDIVQWAALPKIPEGMIK
jgi:hypothetical protein